MSLEVCNNKSIISPTLIIIPNITGFTDYMNNSNIEHSQVVIGTLLETILDNNILNLKVSEIEGDAILFYSYEFNKTIDEIISQCETMFKKFHEKLKSFNPDNCKCGTCERLHNLTLKFVVHFGDLASIILKDYPKLYGKELIVAHKLLKNRIEFNEYMLITKDALSNYESDKSNSKINADWKIGDEFIPEIGVVDYLYKKLTTSKTIN